MESGTPDGPDEERTKDRGSTLRLCLDDRDLTEDNETDDLSPDQSLLSVTMLNQNEDIAGALLTAIVPNISVRLRSSISSHSINV